MEKNELPAGYIAENMPMGDAGRFQSTARSMLYFIACVKNATPVTFIAHFGAWAAAKQVDAAPS
ncbi:MAG: hypothetical protein OXG26_08560 [Caldilineaceae bacterium]|nr:hypothetical protein [Caldilineaceae bacterium]MDE0633703.1 hypothetical protein [Caldilineaceae bacterium]